MEAVYTKLSNFREIQGSSNGKTARYPTRREPNIMGIESTSCGLHVVLSFHLGVLVPFISKLKKL